MNKALQARPLAWLDIAAASGLVRQGDALFVVADDSLLLHRYGTDGTPLATLPLFPGRAPLPSAHDDRKRRKPDLEALVLLPDGALLAIGSGSTAARCRACLIDCTAGTSVDIDLRALYAALADRFPALNIEGAVVRGNHLLLAQRGNGGSDNAIVVLDLAAVQRQLAAGALDAGCLCTISCIALGDLTGVPLALTDLALHPDGTTWFTAAAEDTGNAYDDGGCTGSVIGCLDDDHRVAALHHIAGTLKIEGLAFHGSAGGVDHWLLVADADDPHARAPLLALAVPRR